MRTITFTNNYNPGTFYADVSDYDNIAYIGEDIGVFKELVLGAKSTGKTFQYTGSLNIEYAQRKLREKFVSSGYIEPSPVLPVIEESPIVEEVTVESEDIVEEEVAEEEMIEPKTEFIEDTLPESDPY